MALQKHKNSGKISCFESLFEDKPDMFAKAETEIKAEKKAREEIRPQGVVRSKKRFDPDNLIGQGKLSMPNRILSAGLGEIKDEGGSKSQLGSQNNNSIWNPNRLDEMKEIKSSKEKTIEAREETEKLRNSMKKDRMDEMVESLSKTDTRKDANIQSASSHSERATHEPSMKRHNSIFDALDGKDAFSRIPEKTAGESLSDVKGRKEKADDRYIKNYGTKSSKSITSDLFDRLMQKKEE